MDSASPLVESRPRLADGRTILRAARRIILLFAFLCVLLLMLQFAVCLAASLGGEGDLSWIDTIGSLRALSKEHAQSPTATSGGIGALLRLPYVLLLLGTLGMTWFARRMSRGLVRESAVPHDYDQTDLGSEVAVVMWGTNYAMGGALISQVLLALVALTVHSGWGLGALVVALRVGINTVLGFLVGLFCQHDSVKTFRAMMRHRLTTTIDASQSVLLPFIVFFLKEAFAHTPTASWDLVVGVFFSMGLSFITHELAWPLQWAWQRWRARTRKPGRAAPVVLPYQFERDLRNLSFYTAFAVGMSLISSALLLVGIGCVALSVVCALGRLHVVTRVWRIPLYDTDDDEPIAVSHAVKLLLGELTEAECAQNARRVMIHAIDSADEASPHLCFESPLVQRANRVPSDAGPVTPFVTEQYPGNYPVIALVGCVQHLLWAGVCMAIFPVFFLLSDWISNQMQGGGAGGSSAPSSSAALFAVPWEWQVVTIAVGVLYITISALWTIAAETEADTKLRAKNAHPNRPPPPGLLSAAQRALMGGDLGLALVGHMALRGLVGATQRWRRWPVVQGLVVVLEYALYVAGTQGLTFIGLGGPIFYVLLSSRMYPPQVPSIPWMMVASGVWYLLWGSQMGRAFVATSEVTRRLAAERQAARSARV